MIAQFSAENFRSFKERHTFSLKSPIQGVPCDNKNSYQGVTLTKKNLEAINGEESQLKRLYRGQLRWRYV